MEVLSPIGNSTGDAARLFPSDGSDPVVLTQVAQDRLKDYQAAARTEKKAAWGLGVTVIASVALLAISITSRSTGICPAPVGWILLASAAGGGLIGAGIIAWNLGGAEGKRLEAREAFKSDVETKLKELAEAGRDADAITAKLNSYGVATWKAETIKELLTPTED